MPDISEEANQPRWPGYVMWAVSLCQGIKSKQ